jgi:hypothetical protein
MASSARPVPYRNRVEGAAPLLDLHLVGHPGNDGPAGVAVDELPRVPPWALLVNAIHFMHFRVAMAPQVSRIVARGICRPAGHSRSRQPGFRPAGRRVFRAYDAGSPGARMRIIPCGIRSVASLRRPGRLRDLTVPATRSPSRGTSNSWKRPPISSLTCSPLRAMALCRATLSG